MHTCILLICILPHICSFLFILFFVIYIRLNPYLYTLLHYLHYYFSLTMYSFTPITINRFLLLTSAALTATIHSI